MSQGSTSPPARHDPLPDAASVAAWERYAAATPAVDADAVLRRVFVQLHFSVWPGASADPTYMAAPRRGVRPDDLLFRQVYAFFLVHLASRRVVHIVATCHPTQAWTAQQLRNATMDGDAPSVLLRDRDDKFGPAFDRAAQGVGSRTKYEI